MEEMDVSDTDTLVFTASLTSTKSPDIKSISSNISYETEDWVLSPDTKGTITTELEGKVTVLGLLSNNTSNIEWSNLNNLNQNSSNQFEFDGDELYSPIPVRWSTIENGYNNLKLYLCSPNTIEVNINTSTGAYFDYILPNRIDEHKDIITAYKEVNSKNYNQNIPITFHHAMTALKFKMGFACKVTSITISGVYNKARYIIGSGWSNHSQYIGDRNNGSYSISFGEEGKDFKKDEELFDGVMMMIPQTIPFGKDDKPCITLKYLENGEEKTIKGSLKETKWDEGKLITYTIHKKEAFNYIYFDLNAGSVTIKNDNGTKTYSGSIFKTVDGVTSTHLVSGTHTNENKYYVYQSTSSNKADTGWQGEPEQDGSRVIVPKYEPAYVTDATGKRQLWSDYITNNKWVTKVINAWDNKDGNKGAAYNVNRNFTNNFINVTGAVGTCDIYIDNVYSRYHDTSTGRSTGGIAFIPTSTNNKLFINMIGDNRLSCIHYNNSNESNQLIIQGEGSMTVADADFKCTQNNDRGEDVDVADSTFFSNHWNSAIGSNDSQANAVGIVINSGVLYAGTTKAENCTAIGGGGNGPGKITINGGVVTAVATTTGTAIGGGIGFNSGGGNGTVVINGGNIYAYNHANKWGIPSSAIGGAGSSKSTGATGTVTINGGNVYAESALGTAIGGGSSATQPGGAATVKIYGGYVVAKGGTKEEILSPGIGGGCSYTSQQATASSDYIGGQATIEIGKTDGPIPIIRTGSIGGGSSGKNGSGQIGSANITIYKGDIQAQFVLAASSASQSNSFKMYDGTVRNSYWNDSEYKHIQENGGAVYMKQGTFLMTGGVIKNCSGKLGGAIYIEGVEGANASFTMRLPKGNEPRATAAPAILQSTADQDGGAIYLKNGDVTITVGQIEKNLAKGGNGGGVCIEGGNFTMQGTQTSISENAAYSKEQDQNRNNTNPEKKSGNGGGVYVSSEGRNVSVTIEAGKIEENSSDRYGGGFCVDISNNTEATVTIGVDNNSTSNTDPSITTNRASILGGGLYVSGTNANIDIFDGKINGNFIAGYSANENVTNVGGKVYLANETVDIDKVTVKYKTANGDIYLGSEKVEEIVQYIVKSTDNRIILPQNTTITREGYRHVGWHTEQGGRKDTDGFTDNILNFDVEEITLWAVWE